MAMGLLANPMRHFEVYLGEWSISGPGRAFRIVPVFDGIGIAICINTITRAINCCIIAAIAAVYVVHSISDNKLPYTQCRDFNLKAYEPVVENINLVMLFKRRSGESSFSNRSEDNIDNTTLRTNDHLWRDASFTRRSQSGSVENRGLKRRYGDNGTFRKIKMCKESYSGRYPVLYSTPAYNFFYVEVMKLRPDYHDLQINLCLIISLIVVWLIMWGFMITERILYQRLIWNNMKPWFIAIPLAWAVLILTTAILNIIQSKVKLYKLLRNSVQGNILTHISHALEIALYTHSASTGTEIIHGKGLNHYASGHIDPHLDAENIWHSLVLLVLTVVHTTGSTLCTLGDHYSLRHIKSNELHENTLWTIPMYSKCSLIGEYKHFTSALIFLGLMFSYLIVAYMSLKTALHTIFEYKVKLVFVEQFIVGALILSGMGLSLLVTISGGIALLESIDSLMSGISMPFVCLLELVAMLYVYRSHDFVSEVNVAMEDSVFSSRISSQWKIIPIIMIVTIILKLVVLLDSEIPSQMMYIGMTPLICVILAVPIRACVNTYVFLHKSPRRAIRIS